MYHRIRAVLHRSTALDVLGGEKKKEKQISLLAMDITFMFLFYLYLMHGAELEPDLLSARFSSSQRKLGLSLSDFR